MAIAYVAIGANLGERLSTIRAAVKELGKVGEVRAISSIYETAPVGFADQPAYLNAVVAIETLLDPKDVLTRLLAIETGFGRERSFRNAPRTLDLDLLLYDQVVLNTEFLTLPHPRMHERAFVLVPLNEIAADVVAPGFGQTVFELLVALGPVTGVERYAAGQSGRCIVARPEPSLD